jgi:hypothetical protein
MTHRIVVMPRPVPALRRPHTSTHALVGQRTAQAPDASGRDAGTPAWRLADVTGG